MSKTSGDMAAVRTGYVIGVVLRLGIIGVLVWGFVRLVMWVAG